MQLIDILTDTEREIGKQLVNNQAGTYLPIHYTNSVHAESLINKNVQRLKEQPNLVIKIFFDIDFDGISSGYIMWKMLVELCRCDPTRIIPVINKERKHGITPSIVAEINNDINTAMTIIVDSSTNEPDIFTKLNHDVLIVDHHDIEIAADRLTGQTARGQYYVVNNNIDGIQAKSAAEVVYEFWYNISPSVLQSLMLEEWVAVSLYSDIIDILTPQNIWFTSHLRNLRDNCDIMKILKPLDCVDIRDGHLALTKGSINFKLVPLINSCMRMQAGMDLVLCILYRPQTITSFRTCVTQQKELTTALLASMQPEIFGEIQVAQMKKQMKKKSANTLLGMMQTAETTKKLNTYSDSVIDGFKGLIAGKLCEAARRTTFVYDIVTIDGEQYMKGSARTTGRLAGVELRKILSKLDGWTASGHGDAFGFTYKLTEGKSARTLAEQVQSIIPQLATAVQHQTRYLVADYNLFSKLTMTENEDTITQIRTIAAVNNIKTHSDQYTFDIVPSGGFIQPAHYQETSSIHSFVFSGPGPLRIQLTAYYGLAELEMNNTYQIIIDGCDGNTLLGTIAEASV